MPTDIEEYLNKVCSHIYDKSIKEQTKEEIRCHIEEKIELLQLQGIKEADAIQQVISEMGDADSLSKMMSGVHHEVCFIDLKNAMHKLLIGFIIISIIDSILVFSKSAGYFISVLLIPGVFLFFAGLFQLRNCNKYLRVSYASYVIYTLLKLILIGAKALPLYYEKSYFILYSVVSITFTIVLWFLGYGLKSLIKDDVNTNDLRYCISRSSYLYLVTIPFVILVQNINDYDFKMVIIFFVAMFYIYIIFLIRNVTHATLYNNIHCNVKPVTQKFIISIIIMMFVYLVTPVLFTCYVNGYKVDIEAIVLKDTTAEAEVIKNNLIMLGISEEIVNDLPTIEIMKYESAEKLYIKNNTDIVNGGLIESKMYTCFLGNNVTRVIYYFRWIENSNNNYIDTIQLFIPGYDSYDRESETLLLYCDKDGKTLKLKPVSCDNWRSLFMVKEVSYRMLSNAENQRGYFAVNINEDEAAYHLSVFRYNQRKSLFVYPYSRSMPGIDFYNELDNYYYTSVKTE